MQILNATIFQPRLLYTRMSYASHSDNKLNLCCTRLFSLAEIESEGPLPGCSVGMKEMGVNTTPTLYASSTTYQDKQDWLLMVAEIS